MARLPYGRPLGRRIYASECYAAGDHGTLASVIEEPGAFLDLIGVPDAARKEFTIPTRNPNSPADSPSSAGVRAMRPIMPRQLWRIIRQVRSGPRSRGFFCVSDMPAMLEP